jgi:hypothetical protein
MAPTLQDGDLLLAAVGRPRPGDVVVADLPGGRGTGVKRALRHDVDGWWLERDNPDAGSDSWRFGAVPDADVHAVVRARLWPRPGLVRRGAG